MTAAGSKYSGPWMKTETTLKMYAADTPIAISVNMLSDRTPRK